MHACQLFPDAIAMSPELCGYQFPRKHSPQATSSWCTNTEGSTLAGNNFSRGNGVLDRAKIVNLDGEERLIFCNEDRVFASIVRTNNYSPIWQYVVRLYKIPKGKISHVRRNFLKHKLHNSDGRWQNLFLQKVLSFCG